MVLMVVQEEVEEEKYQVLVKLVVQETLQAQHRVKEIMVEMDKVVLHIEVVVEEELLL